ncbi:unnamed protein product, partial [Brassica oleracea]
VSYSKNNNKKKLRTQNFVPAIMMLLDLDLLRLRGRPLLRLRPPLPFCFSSSPTLLNPFPLCFFSRSSKLLRYCGF